MPDRDPSTSFRQDLLHGRLLILQFLAFCAGVCLFSTINVVQGGPAWFQWPAAVWGVVIVVHVLTVVMSDARRAAHDEALARSRAS